MLISQRYCRVNAIELGIVSKSLGWGIRDSVFETLGVQDRTSEEMFDS